MGFTVADLPAGGKASARFALLGLRLGPLVVLGRSRGVPWGFRGSGSRPGRETSEPVSSRDFAAGIGAFLKAGGTVPSWPFRSVADSTSGATAFTSRAGAVGLGSSRTETLTAGAASALARAAARASACATAAAQSGDRAGSFLAGLSGFAGLAGFAAFPAFTGLAAFGGRACWVVPMVRAGRSCWTVSAGRSVLPAVRNSPRPTAMMVTAASRPRPAMTSVATKTRKRPKNMTSATPRVPKKVRLRAMVVGSSISPLLAGLAATLPAKSGGQQHPLTIRTFFRGHAGIRSLR